MKLSSTSGLLIVVVSILFALGLVMVFSTSAAEILDQGLESNLHSAILKQLFYGLLGLLLAYAVGKYGVERFIEASPKLLVLFSFLLLLCLIPGVGRCVNGSRRWLSLAGLNFQPSEFAKYVIIAYFIHRFRGVEIVTLGAFIKRLLPIALPVFLVLVEPNNGTVGVIGVTCLVLCLIKKIPAKYWAIPLLSVALLGGTIALQLPYVQGRLSVYFNPESDLLGKGHQPYQAKIAAGSGELFGKGPGNSLQKFSYLPEAQNDYIAAIFAEEFGFMGMFVLIILYMVLALSGYAIAYHARASEKQEIALAATFLISFQAFMNLGVVSGLLPSTGLNLPFFSQGGTSLIANMMGLGLILYAGKKEEDSARSRRNGRTPLPSRSAGL